MKIHAIMFAWAVSITVAYADENLNTGFEDPPFRARTGSECQTTDIRETMAPALRPFFQHARNQGQLGFCYANTAADLLSIEIGEPVSSMYLLAQYHSELDAFNRFWRWLHESLDSQWSNYDGGMPQAALQRSIDETGDGYGICAEAEIRSSESDPLPNTELDLKARLRYFDAAVDLAKRGLDYIATLQASQVQPLFTNLSENEFLENFQQSIRESTNDHDTFAILTKKSCHKTFRMPQSLRVLTRIATSNPLLDEIDETLSAPRPRAAAIMYDFGYTRSDQSPSGLGHTLGVHVSSVIGRRFNRGKNRCEYLVRDSFGDSCANYRKKNVDCVGDGTFWISDELLYQITASVSYFK